MKTDEQIAREAQSKIDYLGATGSERKYAIILAAITEAKQQDEDTARLDAILEQSALPGLPLGKMRLQVRISGGYAGVRSRADIDAARGAQPAATHVGVQHDGRAIRMDYDGLSGQPATEQESAPAAEQEQLGLIDKLAIEIAWCRHVNLTVHEEARRVLKLAAQEERTVTELRRQVQELEHNLKAKVQEMARWLERDNSAPSPAQEKQSIPASAVAEMKAMNARWARLHELLQTPPDCDWDSEPLKRVAAMVAAQESAPAAEQLARILLSLPKLLRLLHEIENHCPCGARPETPHTHPHVSSCPVELAICEVLQFVAAPSPALAAMVNVNAQ